MSIALEQRPPAPPPAEPEAPASHSLAELVLRFRELGILLVLAFVVAVTAINNPNFLHAESREQIIEAASIIGLLAIGETMVIVTRNVDLSVGSVLGISAYAAGLLFERHPDIPIGVVVLVGLGIGATCGIVNGAIVTICRVPSLVVTLGTLYVIRGIDGAWAGGHQVGAFSLPDNFNKIGYGTFLWIPYLGWILIAAVAVAAYWMRSFRPGRDLYAIGSNPEAARLGGVPVGARVFLAFVLSGSIAGVTGVLWLSKYGSVDAIAGKGYEFQVIAAVVVGGVAIFGGSGTVVGAALGALLLNTIDNALVVINFGGVTISSAWTSAIAGALLLGAIAFDRLISIRVAPRLSTRRRRRG